MFINFKIRDPSNARVIFDTDIHDPVQPTEEEMKDPNVVRTIKYNFDKSMLYAKQIGTTLGHLIVCMHISRVELNLTHFIVY